MTELPKQDLLLKLLGMTTSASDNEALMAIRRANELLTRAGWTWEMLLKNKIKVFENPFNGISDPRRPKPSEEELKPIMPQVPPRPRPLHDMPNHFADGRVQQQPQKQSMQPPIPRSWEPRPQMGPQSAGPVPRRGRGAKYRPSAGEL